MSDTFWLIYAVLLAIVVFGGILLVVYRLPSGSDNVANLSKESKQAIVKLALDRVHFDADDVKDQDNASKRGLRYARVKLWELYEDIGNGEV